MERQKRGFYLIKRSVAVKNVDWGGYLHTCQRIYRQSTALRNLFNRFNRVRAVLSSLAKPGLLAFLSLLASFPIAGLLAFLYLTSQLTRRGTEARHES